MSGGSDHEHDHRNAIDIKIVAAGQGRDIVVGGIHQVQDFAVAFGIAVPAMYLLCEWFNLPFFTYHPGTNRVDFWWAPARSGEGPTMYWYGWTVLSLLVGSVVGLLATMLPDSVSRKIPLALVWLLPILALIPLAYSLMPFWTK